MSRFSESYKVAATLTSQRVVYMSAANTVNYPNTTTAMPIGITIDDVDDTTEAIAVQMIGKAKLYFNDTVSAGGLVGFDASGRGVPGTTTGLGVIGVLAGAAVAVTGTIAEVTIFPRNG